MAAWEAGAAVWFIVLVAITAWLLRHYARPDTGWTYLITVFWAWYLGFFGAVFLPVDIAASYEAEVTHGTVHDHVKGMGDVWMTVYWITFILAWVIVPVMQEYYASGYFTPKQRIWSAVRANLRFYAVSLVLGIVFVIWILASSTMSLSKLPGFLVTCANVYGLILVVLLGGYGLAEIPRRLWRVGDPERSLRRCEFLAPEVDGAAFDAQSDLEDVLREVRAYDTIVEQIGDPALSEEMHRVKRTAIEGGFAACFEPGASESLDNLAAAVEGSARIDVRRVRSPSSLENDSLPTEAELTTDHLARLHRRLIFAMAAYQKASWHWEMLICDSLALEDQLAGGSPPPVGRNAAHAAGTSQWHLLIARGKWLWRSKVRGPASRVLAVFAGCLSLLIVWCELVLPLRLPSSTKAVNLSPIGEMVYHASSGSGRHFAALVPFAYLCLCTYFGLFMLRPFASVELTGRRQTDAYALMFNAVYLCRLQFSIAFNFINVVSHAVETPAEGGHGLNGTLSVDEDVMFGAANNGSSNTGSDVVILPRTAFAESVGANMKLDTLDMVLPLLMVIFAVITAGNGFNRLLSLVGYDQSSEPIRGNLDHDQQMHEGKRLLHHGACILHCVYFENHPFVYASMYTPFASVLAGKRRMRHRAGVPEESSGPAAQRRSPGPVRSRSRERLNRSSQPGRSGGGGAPVVIDTEDFNRALEVQGLNPPSTVPTGSYNPPRGAGTRRNTSQRWPTDNSGDGSFDSLFGK